MERWTGQVAFVTGTSAGIGKAIAEKLVEHGVKVVGFARRKERLEELEKKLSSKKGKFYPYAGDVSKEEDLLKAFQWTKENVGPVAILINNAGISYVSELATSKTNLWRDTLDVNVLAPCIASREAISHMKDSKIDGHIININSITGHKILPKARINLYPASKFALTALTETLRLELAQAGSKIKVTSISPGVVRTEIFETSIAHENVPKEALAALRLMDMLESADIADATIYALSTPKHVNICELTIQVVGEKM